MTDKNNTVATVAALLSLVETTGLVSAAIADSRPVNVETLTDAVILLRAGMANPEPVADADDEEIAQPRVAAYRLSSQMRARRALRAAARGWHVSLGSPVTYAKCAEKFLLDRPRNVPKDQWFSRPEAIRAARLITESATALVGKKYPRADYRLDIDNLIAKLEALATSRFPGVPSFKI